jgi:5-methyltetrahydrofolate--homocysteine methyltransferase
MRSAYTIELPDSTKSSAYVTVPKDEQAYRDAFHTLRIADGTLDDDGVVVCQAYAEHMGAKVGDEIKLTDAEGNTVYDVSPEEFADAMLKMAQSGASLLGGCCGTTPEYIARLAEKVRGLGVVERKVEKRSIVTSATRICEIGNERLTIIGERINPTGKPKFKDALRRGDIDYAVNEAHNEAAAGADILDVNVGLPEIDECAVLTEAVCRIQSVCDLPLQIDTALPTAMEAALRRYNGKAMINSVNGKAESMAAVFPLVKKYGGVVVALTLDESGIPETVDGRFEIAKKILSVAESYGIDKKDLIFDTLTMTVSASPSAAKVTLGALQRIREELGCNTVLGVSNVSFGLPNRDLLNSVFFANALDRGLSAAIMNPYSAEMMKAYYAFRALEGLDDNCGEYIGFAQSLPTEAAVQTAEPVNKSAEQYASELQGAVVKGLCEAASRETLKLLESEKPLDIVQDHIIPALDIVGEGFEKKTVFLPQLLMSAEAAGAAAEEIKVHILKQGGETATTGCRVVLATVQGDIHDIGKNIVKLLLENYGFTVLDLGKDVPPEEIAERAAESGAPLVGLSALMTTTVPAMEETIRLLRQKAPTCRVMVGGAVLNKEYAAAIGADFYAADAMEGVGYARRVTEVL